MKKSQILALIRLLGVPRLTVMKFRHDRALPIIRGYCTTVSLWAMLNTGAIDVLRRRGWATPGEIATDCALDERILRYILEYLDLVRILKKSRSGGRYALSWRGRAIMEEPRGVFDLACGYEPVLFDLTGLLKGEVKFGRDVTRRMKFIAQGSGELGTQLPFPVMADLVVSNGFRRVLDLGCGDCEFLMTVCRAHPDVRCYGIDVSTDAVAHARERLAGSEFETRITLEVGDLFEVDGFLRRWGDVDVMTACDTFHEHLFEGDRRVKGFLSHCHAEFPKVGLVVAEFCRQPHDRLRRRPNAFVEHHLWHNLTDQVILSAQEWRAMFGSAGYRIVDERIYDVVGHGYFALK